MAAPAPAPDPPADAEVQFISDSQVADLEVLIQEVNPNVPLFFKWLEAVTGAKCVEDIPAESYGKVVAKLQQRRAAGGGRA